MTNFWIHDCSSHRYALGRGCVYRPDAHPLWSHYQISLIHLRTPEGEPPAIKIRPEATHELVVVAIERSAGLDPADPDTFRPLLPLNLVVQLETTDEQATWLWGMLCEAFASGRLNPDTDHRPRHLDWLRVHAEMSETRDAAGQLSWFAHRVEPMVAFGARCSWWDDKAAAAVTGRGSGLPRCPSCGGVLFESLRSRWDEETREHADQSEDPNYVEFIAWARGKCFPSTQAARAAYAATQPN